MNMSAAQEAGAPPAGGEQAAAAPDESYDPGGSLKEALSALQSGDDAEGDAETDDVSEDGEGASPDADEGDEKKPEAEQGEPDAFSVEAYRAKVLEALKDLTPEQRDEVLGTTEDSFAALTAKRRRLHREREQHAKEKQAYEAEIGEYKALRKEWDDALVVGKQNPIEALALFGWSLKDAYEFDATGTVPPEMQQKALEERIEARLSEQAKELEQERERVRAAERHLNEMTWHSNVKQAVASMDEQQFPLTKRFPSEEIAETVIGMQRSYFERMKQPLATDKALWHIEQRLTQQHKFLVGSDPARAGDVQPSKPEAGRKGPRTLSSSFTGERVSDDGEEDLDPSERTKLALKALRGDG